MIKRLLLLPLLFSFGCHADIAQDAAYQTDEPLGSAFALDEGDLGLDAWVASYRGAEPGHVNLAATLRGLGELEGYAPIVEDEIQIYLDDCADAVTGTSSFADCRQTTLSSPWWSRGVPSDFTWRRDASQFGPNTMLLAADLTTDTSVLTRPLTIALPFEHVETGIYQVCRLTMIQAVTQTVAMANGAFELELWGRWDPTRDRMFVTIATDAALPFPDETITDVRMRGVGDVEVIGGCHQGAFCVAAEIEREHLAGLFRGTGAVEIEAGGEVHRGSLEAGVMPSAASLMCAAGTPGCVHGEAVACTGGANQYGQAVDPAGTYCGQSLCGADGKVYFCGSGRSWGSTDQVCR